MELSFVCKRKTLLTEIDPHSFESAVIEELPGRIDIKVIPFRESELKLLKNGENVDKLSI